jgi:hypothetical protein
METPEPGLNFLVVALLSAVFLAIFIRRRYGLVGKQLTGSCVTGPIRNDPGPALEIQR